jgi:hypothetical protein
MNSRSWRLHSLQLSRLLWLAIFAAVSIASLMAQTPSFVTFDAPDAGRNKSQGTFPESMNQNGVIAGIYIDKFNLNHCFLRLANGQITEFDVFPPSIPNVRAINGHNQIVGFAQVKGQQGRVDQGFLRNPNGATLRIDVPSAISTFPYAINEAGEIAGTYADALNIYHGFLRDAAGNYSLFDEPNSGLNPNFGTAPFALNGTGTVAGNYNDTNNLTHGFIRDPAGNFTTVDAPGAGTELGTGTSLGVLNSTGDAAGIAIDDSFLFHPFIRDPSGNFTSWDIPGSTSIDVIALNDLGAVVGQWFDTSSLPHAYQRTPLGNVTSFSVPVPNTGSTPMAISNRGRIAGMYSDLRSVSHGFVR